MSVEFVFTTLRDHFRDVGCAANRDWQAAESRRQHDVRCSEHKCRLSSVQKPLVDYNPSNERGHSQKPARCECLDLIWNELRDRA
jgi:hypothetical protein